CRQVLSIAAAINDLDGFGGGRARSASQRAKPGEGPWPALRAEVGELGLDRDRDAFDADDTEPHGRQRDRPAHGRPGWSSASRCAIKLSAVRTLRASPSATSTRRPITAARLTAPSGASGSAAPNGAR